VNKVRVRCWETGPNQSLYVTFPDGFGGHNLICCRNCGEIYAVNVILQLYLEADVDRQLSERECEKCQHKLASNWLRYPDNHLKEDGSIGKFNQSEEYPYGEFPLDEHSIVKEFWDIYS